MIRDYDDIYLREPQTDYQSASGSFDFTVFDNEGEEYPVTIYWTAEWPEDERPDPEKIEFDVIGFNQPLEDNEPAIREHIFKNEL